MNRDLKNVLVAGAIILGLIIVASVWGGFIGWGNGFGGMMGGFGLGMFGIGMVVMIAFWVLVIWGIVSLIRWLTTGAGGGGMPSSRGPSALEILQQRYARGEINKEEYEEKKRDLGG